MYIMKTDYIKKSKYTRTGKKLKSINGIVIHYVANPKSTARNNRDYFNNLPSMNRYNKIKGIKEVYASAHEIIGLDGEIVKCIPHDEIAYHCGSRSYTKKALSHLGSYPNLTTYSIEFCHTDDSGKPSPSTQNTLIERLVDLCIEFDLDPITNKVIWTHKEVVGWKDCPLYYVKNPKAYHILIDKVKKEYVRKMDREKEILESWKVDLGLKSLNLLSDEGIINNKDKWFNKLSYKVPLWLFFTIIARIIKFIKKRTR